MVSTYSLTLDVAKDYVQNMIDIKKGDGGEGSRKIIFSLSDAGSPVDMASIDSAVFMAKKPSGNLMFNECTIEEDGKVEYILTTQTSAETGILECELRLYDGESIVTSPRFNIKVTDCAYLDGVIESTNEFTALTNAISATNNLNAAVTKTGSTATITITKKDGTRENTCISDGEKGDTGSTPIISATATVDQNVGTPSVSITKSGTDENPSFAFAFSNIKGADAATDEHYDPTSENAQSGKAVAEAVSTKVDKVNGKSLSTNDYTNRDKGLVGTISQKANLSDVYSKSQTESRLSQLNSTIESRYSQLNSAKVDKVNGKQLSTEDFTTAEKTKLSGIEASAEVNKIDEIKVNGTAQQISNKGVDISVPTKTSDLTNDSNFVTHLVNNLANYYLKSETYTKEEIQERLAAIKNSRFSRVQTLPPIAEAEENVIYLVPRTSPETSNTYDEYIKVEVTPSTTPQTYEYEKIGSTDIDLTGYATETWVNAQIANFLTQTQIEGLISTALANKADKSNILNYITYTIDNATQKATISLKPGVSRTDLTGSFVIPETIEGYIITGIGTNCFKYCTNITSIVLPDTVLSIGSECFNGCRNLQDIYLGKRLKTINYAAFQNCTSLTSIVFPSTLTSIGGLCFQGCTSLENVYFDNCELLSTIPNNVFYGCKISKIEIPNSVTSIEDYAFYQCKQLKEICLPFSLTSIGAGVFSQNLMLTDVYYEGSRDDWGNITIDTSDVYYFNRATKHYNQKSAIIANVKWRKIVDLTLTEDTNSPALLITKDINNNDFLLTNVRIRAIIPTNGDISGTYENGRIITREVKGGNWAFSTAFFPFVYKNQDNIVYAELHCEDTLITNYALFSNIHAGTAQDPSNNGANMFFSGNRTSTQSYVSIAAINMQLGTANWKSGTHIVIEGMDA